MSKVLSPAMTSNTMPSPFVASASSVNGPTFDAWYPFNGSGAVADYGWKTANFVTGAWLQLYLGGVGPLVVTQYQIVSRTASEWIQGEDPGAWTFQGSNDGSTWVTLDTQSGQTGWTAGSTHTFGFTNTTGYSYYRINISANQPGFSIDVAIGQLIFSYTVPMAPNYVKTGKENALYSLYVAIGNQFTGWAGNLSPNTLVIDYLSYNQNVTYPSISIQDVGGPSLGNKALARNLQEGFTGYEEQTQVEFNVYDQNVDGTSAYNFAEQNVRRIRDVLKDYLENAGHQGQGTSGFIYPGIHLVDGNNGNADTQSQVWFDQETPGTWTETYIANNAENVNEKRYRIYCRIHWTRFTSTPSGND